MLRLIKLWLKAPIEERDGDGKRRIVGGNKNKLGTPQGGVASPLLANIYMNRFLKHWRLSGRGVAFPKGISLVEGLVGLVLGMASAFGKYRETVVPLPRVLLTRRRTRLTAARYCKSW